MTFLQIVQSEEAKIRWGILLATWLGVGLRLQGLFSNHFHADEALFASWARWIAVWADPLLINQAVDKPPLLFYLQAMFYPMQGPVEWAARLPNWIASVVLVPLVGIWCWRVWDGQTAVVASFATALNPYGVAFAPTAFTDPLMVTLAMIALVLADRRAGWAGIWLGLALLTKYQAVFFVPLVWVWGWWCGWRWRENGRFALALVVCIGVLVGWDVARTGAFGLIGAQASNFGEVGLLAGGAWERLGEWYELLQFFYPLPVLMTVFVAGLVYFSREKGRPMRLLASFDLPLLLLGFVVVYLVVHWVLSVPAWDRYLLPVTVILGIVWARGWRRMGWGWQVLCLSLFLWPLVRPSPIGGQPTADDGAHEVAQVLAEEPYGTVLYDHWYSWQWQYHLFDKRVFMKWVPHPQDLLLDLEAYGEDGETRYMALPANEAERPFTQALQQNGYALVLTHETHGMRLYRIVNE